LLWSYTSWSEAKVKRVTKTQIVLGNEYESKYRKSDGYRVGESYSRNSIKAVGAKELAEFRVRKAEEEELKIIRLELRNKMRELPRYQNMSKEEAQVLLEAVEKIKAIRNKAING
jgi:hypothetical protein